MNSRSMLACLCAVMFVLTASVQPVWPASVPAAKPDKGLVVFYRLKKAKGAAIRFEITDASAKSLGNLSNGSMVHEYLEPGQHTFRARSPSVDGSDSITLDVAAGDVFYVQGEILWGLPAGRPKFTRKQESQALADIQKL
jgi:hypothetical protein